MKFNLKLLIGIMTLLLCNGFVYAAEQKENFENESWESYFEEKSRDLIASNSDLERLIPDMIAGSKPKWYVEWRMKNTRNPEEYAFMSLASNYENINSHGFDEAIEKLKKDNVDINNILYPVENQTLLMKILEIVPKIDSSLSNFQKNLQQMSNATDPTNFYRDMKINAQNKISRRKEQIKKLKDIVRELLPYVNDFDIKDGSGKTVFDYAKGDEEIVKLLVDARLALEERKKKIREHLQEGLPVKDLQDIVLGY